MIPRPAKYKKEPKGAVTGTLYGHELKDGILDKTRFSFIPAQITVAAGTKLKVLTISVSAGYVYGLYSYSQYAMTADATAGLIDVRWNDATREISVRTENNCTSNLIITYNLLRLL